MNGTSLSNFIPMIVAAIAAVAIAHMSGKIDYRCENCGAMFRLPPLSSVFSPHWMGRKLAACPHCRERGWAVPVWRGR